MNLKNILKGININMFIPIPVVVVIEFPCPFLNNSNYRGYSKDFNKRQLMNVTQKL
jgi:hypothetical protein